jgi:hypothetical protein
MQVVCTTEDEDREDEKKRRWEGKDAAKPGNTSTHPLLFST